jgi:hypothetical protein
MRARLAAAPRLQYRGGGDLSPGPNPIGGARARGLSGATGPPYNCRVTAGVRSTMTSYRPSPQTAIACAIAPARCAFAAAPCAQAPAAAQ